MDLCSGSLLIPVIMTKLPSEIRLRIARESTDAVWKLDKLMGVVKAEVEAREASEGARLVSHKSSSSNHNFKPTTGHNVPSAGTFITNEFKLQCAYCEGAHYLASCEKVQNVKERRNILLKASRCFNCLKPNHKVKDCHNTRTCRSCSKRHHQSICDHQKQPSTTDLETPRESSTLNSLVKEKQTILLQTAQVISVNPATNLKKLVLILLDNGSQSPMNSVSS